MMHLTAIYYHITHTIQIESTLYSSLNVKELLAQNSRKEFLDIQETIWLSCCVKVYMYGKLSIFIEWYIRFRLNLHSAIAWMSRNSFLERGLISEITERSFILKLVWDIIKRYNQCTIKRGFHNAPQKFGQLN